MLQHFLWTERLLAYLGAALLFAGPASAVSFPLDTEFDDALSGNYATVSITENAGDLDFSITLDTDPPNDPPLGPTADLHEFYFNLLGTFTGLLLSSTDPQTGALYSLSASPSVAGGAGADFDFGVNFGNGGGPPGNGPLQSATFKISANEALTIADLFETSSTSDGTVVVHVAAHVQGTSLTSGATSETVGGIIPEPASALLVALGMGGLGVYARRAAPRGTRRHGGRPVDA